MVFRPARREAIEMLRAVLMKLEPKVEGEDRDLTDLRDIILKRITELEAAATVESPKADTSTTHPHAA
jgi:hypothetical protein